MNVCEICFAIDTFHFFIVLKSFKKINNSTKIIDKTAFMDFSVTFIHTFNQDFHMSVLSFCWFWNHISRKTQNFKKFTGKNWPKILRKWHILPDLSLYRPHILSNRLLAFQKPSLQQKQTIPRKPFRKKNFMFWNLQKMIWKKVSNCCTFILNASTPMKCKNVKDDVQTINSKKNYSAIVEKCWQKKKD